ncbi:MAG: hypothetical protein K8S55_06995 [Phycisphaerae bacterium]|nr:hypothetical protein [Phycisphaerae bacterium]
MDENLQKAIASLVERHGIEVDNIRSLIDGCHAFISPFVQRGLASADILRELGDELEDEFQPPIVKLDMFNDVPLPTGLKIGHLEKAMNYTASMIASINRDMCRGIGSPLIQFIQANNFSGIISNILTSGLDKYSPYKHNHDQRFPDLKNAGGMGLEMKAANKAGKGGESHNGHGGWHLIACFELDEENGNIQFVQLEIAELISNLDEPEGDWHYCGSKVNASGSRRTETYYTTNRGTWKLRDGSVYLDTDKVNYKRWRRQGISLPPHSPLA